MHVHVVGGIPTCSLPALTGRPDLVGGAAVAGTVITIHLFDVNRCYGHIAICEPVLLHLTLQRACLLNLAISVRV